MCGRETGIERRRLRERLHRLAAIPPREPHDTNVEVRQWLAGIDGQGPPELGETAGRVAQRLEGNAPVHMRQRLGRVRRKTPPVALDRVGEVAGIGERETEIEQHACLVWSDLERFAIRRDRSRGIASLAVPIGDKAERNAPAFADRVVDRIEALELAREKATDARILASGEM